jgi:2-keto-4-pentenoate hydratase/2-oxohepta-3-ene-1,7-dioic acid hydratase in catechol pathway
MTRLVSGLALVALLSPNAAVPRAQSSEPFKLGSFQRGSDTFAGLVVGDRLVARIDEADATLPRDVMTIISRYDELRPRLQAIANRVSQQSEARPAYVSDLNSVKVQPPVMPGTILNAAVNYTEHAEEMQGRAAASAPAPAPIPGIWERTAGDTRHNPYLFMKARSSVIADGESIRIPPGVRRSTSSDTRCRTTSPIVAAVATDAMDRTG